MTTPTPRELSADEIAAIRVELDAYRATLLEYTERTYLDPDFEAVISNLDICRTAVAMRVPDLLAHVAAVDARCRAYEAALRPFAETYHDMRGWSAEALVPYEWLEQAALALGAANGDGGRGNDGSGSGEAG